MKAAMIFLCMFFFCLFTVTKIHANNISSNAITGNWNSGGSWAGGVVPTKDDTVSIVSGSNITVDFDTAKCYKLKINSGGILNLSSHILRCCGSLVSKFVSPSTYWYIGNGHCTIYTGGTLNMNTGTLCLTGDLTTNGTFSCGTGTVVFDTKRAPIAIYGLSIPTFYKVINNDSVPGSYPLAGGFGVTLHNDNTIFNGDIIINGSFNRNSSATNDTVDITFAGTTNLSGVYSFYLNDVIINNGATLNAGTKTIYLYGNWTCNGTFICGTGTIWFSRDPNNALVQNIYQANPSANPFYNIYVNKSSGDVAQLSGTLNPNGNIYVSNNFTVNKGTYDIGGVHRLYVAGNFIINGTNGGIFIGTNGRLLMNGTNAGTPQTLNTGGSSLYKYTIDNSGAGVIQASDVTITYELQFTNGIQYTKNGSTLYELYLSNSDAALSMPSGYSATSFVVGKFRRAVTAANNYTFPIGPLNTSPIRYRPVIYQQTAAGGATNIFMVQDAISNSATWYADWWTQIQPDAGTPTGSLNFPYNLSTDFQSGMTECDISALRGNIPPPADWNTVLATTVAPSGGNNGSITATISSTLSPYAYILGEPVPVVNGTTICSGNSTVLNVSSPSGWGFYNWYDSASGGTLLQASSTSYSTPVLNSTTTYYVAFINPLTSCESDRTAVIVTVIAAPSVNAGSNNSVCAGNSYTVSGSSATNYTSLNWTSSGSGSFANNGTLTPTYTPSAADISTGSVTLTLTAAGNSPCGNYTDDIVLTINALPTANAGMDATICSGSSTLLSASGGTSYAWSPSAGLSSTTTSNPTANPTTSTTYTVTVTSSGGCTATDAITVNVNTTPTANAGTDASIPNGTSTSLSGSASGGSGSYTYTWSPSGSLVNTNVQNPTTTNLSTTTVFTLTVIDNSTSCQSTDQVTITVTGGILSVNTTATSYTICNGQSTQLNALASGGSGTYTYSWASNPSGFSSTSQNPMVTPTSTTTYTVTVNDGFNTASSGLTVSVNPLPTANAGGDVSVCSGNSVILGASGGTSYAWSPSSGLSATNISNPVASPTSNTTYLVTVTDANGCSNTDDVNVTVDAVPTANAGSDVAICSGNSAGLSASGGSGYAWSPSAGLSATDVNNPVANPTSTTTYTVIVTNAQGCTDSDNITVIVNPLPNANAGNDQTICSGQVATLTATGGGTYAWNAVDFTPSINVSPASTYTYTVTVTSTQGCSATDDVTVFVNPLPAANAGSDVAICVGNSTMLNASGGTTYTWSPSTGLSDANISNPNANPSSTTSFIVTVTDANNCSATDDVTVTVNSLPVAFTGNDTTICEGNSLTVSAAGGDTYAWNTGDSTSSFSVYPSSTSTYIVTVTDIYGCSASDDITVNVTATPVITLATEPTDNSIYIGQLFTVTTTPSSFSNYSFYIDSLLAQEGQSNSYTSASMQDGQIIYVIADDEGCFSTMDSIVIDVKPIPNAFTPLNGDDVNDLFLKGLDLTVFNRWGQKIHTGTDGWNGKYNGNYVSKGTYYFIIKMPDINNNITEIKGSVTVVN
ncbi:MAG: gliding motility-associated C-terminal domain-containing protein [Bacteroidota bacterium]